MKDCIETVRMMALAADLTLKFECPPTPIYLTADRRRFKQILLNLLTNAVKFTLPGGFVQLYCEALDDGGVAFMVADDGVGMDKQALEQALRPYGRVLNPFVRGREGVGLGLPLVKGLIDAHDGVLIIESRDGEGTTVSVRFPAARVQDPISDQNLIYSI